MQIHSIIVIFLAVGLIQMLTSNCELVMRELVHDAHEDYRLDPQLTNVCKKDVRKLKTNH